MYFIISFITSNIDFAITNTRLMQSDELSTPLTIVSLLNGMIGGSILVIPLAAQQAGYLGTIIVILVAAIFNYASCRLSLMHISDQKDLDHALMRHFNGSKPVKMFYDICLCSGFLLIEILYFDLITIQWIGLAPPYEFTYLNLILNGVVLLVFCLVMKYFEFGAHLMGYGIVSIIGYLVFLVYVMGSAPEGDRSVPVVGSGMGGFAAMMSSALSIQGYFVPVLKKNKNKQRHAFYILITYACGVAVYIYIAFMGGIGILNRQIQISDSKTIEAYFQKTNWQVKILEVIYLVHLYSVFPEYLLISKRLFFSLLNLKQSQKGKIFVNELVYIVGFICICFGVTSLKIKINVLIEINGAVLGFAIVYCLPIAMHLRCLYFAKGKKHMIDAAMSGAEQQQGQKQIQIELEQKSPNSNPPLVKEHPKQQQMKASKLMNLTSPQQQQSLNVVDYSYYYCSSQKQKGWKQYLVLGLLGVMMAMGVFILVRGLMGVVDTVNQS